MMRDAVHTNIALAGLLSLLLLALSAMPATAATVQRGHQAEDLAFRLVNCIRTGGFVTKTGKCKNKGSGKHSRYVKPLKNSSRISNKVAWPWARRSVQFYGKNRCWVGHARNGSTVNKRFVSVSLKAPTHGENMGCASYAGKRSVILLVRMWQAEKSYRGWHWRNVKDPDYKSAGVGVAKIGSRKTQLVFNFYGKKVR